VSALVIVEPETVIRWHRAGSVRSGDGSRESRRQTEGAALNSPTDPRHGSIRQRATPSAEPSPVRRVADYQALMMKFTSNSYALGPTRHWIEFR
jgi:hypothetical protein